MKKKILFILLVLLPVLLFSQGNAEKEMQDSGFYTATDANGRTVTLEEKPYRVIIAGKAGNMSANALFLFPEVEAMDLTLPITDQGLGDFFSLIRPSLDEKPRISQNASAEEIAAQNPQIVLTKTANYEKIGKKLDQLRIPNFTMNLESYEDWKTEITQLGKLLKNTTRAQQILSLFQERLDSITNTVSSLAPENKLKVLILQGVTTDNASSFKIAPDSWMQTWMAENVGGVPVWKGANTASNGWSTVSFEQIAAWNPDKIYIVSYKTPTETYVNEIYSSPIWANLKAVKNHNVEETPSDMMNYIQPVATWILGMQWMAQDLYPELFASVDMEEEITSFYREFYGLTDQKVLDTLLSAYKTSISLN
ncbi:ABC-type Fe3+-hydroxamate transport system, periplasmic component [Sphaerochaeta pleomorpha str. Grapes]|uniref:ABC-type Fe3+-hydroxamate transport system, periplasmic component n=1 Tax=Sphaerochaeta pleomorpha (strain ATCC BAA-1885 / DSM 22778 / Grapes) TaxID=158190 RepID=G8QQK0_SPHPG|nr:ABC transporter substrate-binding protein [Sphaerochaeta pleomorpha]AEV30930.1 ABC-type Fe3+-hydroxamate transport system, periplasmic component [Sphaerochaeta pleomorpha str. Grapes]